MGVYQIYIFFVDMAKFLHRFNHQRGLLGYRENLAIPTRTWSHTHELVEGPREREREVESYMRVFDWDTFCMTNVTVDPFSLFIDVQICVVSSSLFPLGTFYHSRLK